MSPDGVFLLYINLVQQRFDNIISRGVFIFTLYVLITILLHKCFVLVSFPLSLKFVMFSVALGFGVVFRVTGLQVYIVFHDFDPKTIFMVFHPIYLVKMGFDLERHVVNKITFQVILLCGAGLVFVTIFMGIGINHLSSIQSSLLFTITLGIALSSIDNIDQATSLKEYENLRYVLVMLECESLLGTSISLIIIQILLGISAGIVTQWYQFLLIFSRYTLGGIFIGLVISWRMQMALLRFCINLEMSVLFILTIVYSVYYLCEYLLYFSGPVASVIVILGISFEKTRLPKELCIKLDLCWNALYVMSEFLLYFVFAIVSVYNISSKIDVTLISENIISYILSSLGRLATISVLIPAIVHMGNTTQYKSMITLFWLGKKGIWQILTFFLVLNEPTMRNHALSFLPLLIILISLTLLINGSTGLCCLKLFGITLINNIKKNNIKHCMEFIEAKKKRFIATMKINRYYADTCWDICDEQTKIPVPKDYVIGADGGEDEEKWNLKPYCTDCKKEFKVSLTKRDINRMTTEAKIKILKTHKICTIREHEKGLLSATALRPLIATIESAMDHPKLTLPLDKFIALFHKKTWFHSFKEFLISIDSENITCQVPRKCFRRICFRICMNNTYEILLYLVIVTIYIMMLLELFAEYEFHSSFAEIIIFSIHFILKVLAYSHIYIKDGLVLYLKSHWNKIDLAILFFNYLKITIQYLPNLLVPDFEISEYTFINNLLTNLDFLTSLRLLKIVVILYEYRKIFMSICDTILNTRMGFLLDIAQSLLVSYDEVIHALPSIVPDADIRKSLETELNSDRKILIHEIISLEMKYPSVAVTVKTKKAMRFVMYSIRESAFELKTKGFIDNSDFEKYLNTYEEKMKQILKIKQVKFKNHESTFYEVPWMWNSHDLSIFLYINSTLTTFRPGETIIESGTSVNSVYVIVEGYAYLEYDPRTDYKPMIGALPIKDYITSINFQNHKNEILLPGNSIGELGVLTRRPSNCSITCETEVKAFEIPSKLLFDAMDYKDSINCLFNDMWTFISVHFSVILLCDTIIYKHYTRQDLYTLVLDSFIPDLSSRDSFANSEKVRDLILVEGILNDVNSNTNYYAPCFLPRTAQKLYFKKNIGHRINPKILIIPVKKGNKADILKYQDIRKTLSQETIEPGDDNKKTNKKQTTGDLKSILKQGKR